MRHPFTEMPPPATSGIGRFGPSREFLPNGTLGRCDGGYRAAVARLGNRATTAAFDMTRVMETSSAPRGR